MNAPTNPAGQATFGFLILMLSTLMSCQPKDTTPTPDTTKPGSGTTTQPGSGTTTQPNNGTTTQPGSGTTTPPGNTQPTDSVNLYKRVKISWSVDDFQEILYDVTGLPVQYASQYVYDQGSGRIQRKVYKLHYNAGKQLERVDIISGNVSSYVTYQYNGNQVSQTNEYSLGAQLIGTCTYQYSAPSRLSQVDESRTLGNITERRTYQYDARGNLSLLSTYGKNTATGIYELHSTLVFSEYDTEHDVENLLFHMPLLPNAVFRTNNHGLKILRNPDGSEASRERTVYVYNELGYPVEQIRTGPGGRITATYTYWNF